MAKVLILLGSKSDERVMKECFRYLLWFGIQPVMEVASAHRDPEKVGRLSFQAKEQGYSCIIGAAGMAAALPGVISSHSNLPVIGVPLEGGLPGGLDALYSMVQMPPGIPVGTVAVGKAGARNAAVLAARIIALHDKKVDEKLSELKAIGYKIPE